VQPRLLNDLAPYLSWKPIKDRNRRRSFPRSPICPSRAEIALFQQPDNSLGITYWLTGYIYCARLNDARISSGTILNPSHIADAKGRHRGVLWADTLMYSASGATPIGYSFFHFSGSISFNPAYGTSNTCTPWNLPESRLSDGSVERITAPASISIPAT